MNLYLLVEGDRTEPRVYREWIKLTFPHLTGVDRLSEVTADCYFIFRGGGYPSYIKRIKNALADIAAHPRMDHFFVCVDSEERSCAERLAEVQGVIEQAEAEIRVRAKHPRLQSHVIVQHCCLETWFLGHTRMMRRNPSSTRLVEMKRFYDVSVNDPELMGRPSGYLTRSDFHLEYLKEMLREQGKTYSKIHPGVVTESSYLDALRHRWGTTGHLSSLGRLLSTWEAL
ncbi:MAG TPA: hypothetical protein VLS89_17060 [Candidatus Nanopelagicales bacterium]|nr:hypothetical protein [Candidatus Nanopelagicales bacterium]